MRNFFFPENPSNIAIDITAVDYINFSELDARIQHTGRWLESNPMQTKISVPKECSEEIIAKLKLHDGITEVNGETTVCGRAVFARK